MSRRTNDFVRRLVQMGTMDSDDAVVNAQQMFPLRGKHSEAKVMRMASKFPRPVKR